MLKTRKMIIVSLILALLLLMNVLVFANGDIDLEGRTVTFGYNQNLEQRHFDDPESIAWLEEVEDTFNVNIEFDTFESQETEVVIEEMAPQIMSGDMSIDFWIVRGNVMQALAMEGFIHQLDYILDDDYWNSVNPWAKEAQEAFKYPIDQKYYGVVTKIAGWQNGMFLIWNKDLFERQGLTSPYELYEQGEWTWDNFLDIAKQATRDTTGDGEIDQWGYAPWKNWSTARAIPSIGQFLVSNDAEAIIRENGQAKFGLDSDQFLETLRFLQDLYPEGGMTPGDSSWDDWLDGNVAMLSTTQLFRLGTFRDDMDAHYSVVPMPKGPNQDKHVALAPNYFVGVMPIVEENPEELLAVHDMLFRITEEHRTSTWEESHESDFNWYSTMVKDKESLEILKWAKDNTVVSPTLTSTFIPNLVDIIDDILVEGESVSATIESYKPSIKEFIEENLN